MHVCRVPVGRAHLRGVLPRVLQDDDKGHESGLYELNFHARDAAQRRIRLRASVGRSSIVSLFPDNILYISVDHGSVVVKWPP